MPDWKSDTIQTNGLNIYYIAHIPEAGHNIRREQFTRYMEAVGTFLGQVIKRD